MRPIRKHEDASVLRASGRAGGRVFIEDWWRGVRCKSNEPIDVRSVVANREQRVDLFVIRGGADAATEPTGRCYQMISGCSASFISLNKSPSAAAAARLTAEGIFSRKEGRKDVVASL